MHFRKKLLGALLTKNISDASLKFRYIFKNFLGGGFLVFCILTQDNLEVVSVPLHILLSFVAQLQSYL